MPPAKKDFGASQLRAWTTQAARSVEGRYAFALNSGELADNPAFYCLLGRGARKGVGLSYDNQKACLLVDEFFVDWFREAPVTPAQAARGAFGYMLLRRQDSPRASRMSLAEGLLFVAQAGVWIIWAVLALGAGMIPYTQFPGSSAPAFAWLNALAVGGCFLAIGWNLPETWSRGRAAFATTKAWSSLKGGKTSSSRAAALPSQFAHGCGCMVLVLFCALGSQIVAGFVAASMVSTFGLPQWAVPSWTLAIMGASVLWFAQLISDQRREAYLALLEKTFEEMKLAEEKD